MKKGKHKQDVRSWLDEGKHLPLWLRDFHDQKETFRAIEETWGRAEGAEDMDWIKAHCYTIDRFLRFMGSHGFTLQQCRANIAFNDLNATFSQIREKRVAEFKKMLDQEKFRGVAGKLNEPSINEKTGDCQGCGGRGYKEVMHGPMVMDGVGVPSGSRKLDCEVCRGSGRSPMPVEQNKE